MDLCEELDLYIKTMQLGTDILKNVKYNDDSSLKEKKETSMEEVENCVRKNMNVVQKKKRNRKKNVENVYDSNKTLVKKPKVTSCPHCEWIFPRCFNRKNSHIENCLKGDGKKDIVEYHEKFKQQRKAKSKSKRDKKKEDIKTIENNCNLEVKVFTQHEDIVKCLDCNLSLGSRTNEFVEKHLKYCKSEQEKFLGYFNRPKVSIKNLASLFGSIVSFN
ncbi:hypothetical protein SteCoe_13045 [Stentor coeruleus]|uniref:Uncharacterized protein n=1 Tax=Stentor coeruleus TaxID=5963 RepID=A0A1R2C9E5_9CILI|nr:hypothetical protein SteCoe_13045 [Stentor coeruleus]